MRNWKHKSVINLIEESGNFDPIVEIRNRARDLVLQALERGWIGPPFNALELARIIGIEVNPNDGIIDARTIPVSAKKQKIEYNPFQKPTRINFSVAHEIAHTLFSDCNDEIRNRESEPNANRQLEMLCNIGASEIQLPYAVFSNDANSIENITLESLIELATKYKSSLESLFIRFAEVVNKPCAIMICSFKEVDKLVLEYATTSTAFSTKIPNGVMVPNDSKAYECTSPGWSARETVKWDFLDDNCEIYCIGLSPMRKDNRGRVGIIVTNNFGAKKLQDEKVNIEFGDATKPRGKGKKIIAQVVNTSGGLGLGFGKSLSKNYPIIKEKLQGWSIDKTLFKLGSSQLIQVDSEVFVFQMLAQKGLYEKNGEIPLKYSSLRDCLIDLYLEASRIGASIHMPLIGAGQAKGDWNIIQGIIYDELVHKGINVFVYVLPGKNPVLKTKSNLTLFNEQSTWDKEK